MGNRKPNAKELAISRVTVMLFSLVLLSLLTYLYIIPFKKHYLQINNYYVYIEYAAMAVTFLAFAAAVVFSRLKRGLDYSQRLITPNYFLILSCAAFAAAAQLKQNAIIQICRDMLCMYSHSVYSLLLYKSRFCLSGCCMRHLLRAVFFDRCILF